MAYRRVTLDLTEEASAEVDRIVKARGMTVADVFRQSFTLLRIYFDAVDAKQEMRIVDPKDRSLETRIILPRK